jgi:hypothetical protein
MKSFNVLNCVRQILFKLVEKCWGNLKFDNSKFGCSINLSICYEITIFKDIISKMETHDRE